jgi:hypothetical protein
VNAISRSGGEKFHGNLDYYWNGDVLNANDWFYNNTTPTTPRPFSNSNQWAAAIGGPAIKNKTFFFANLEGVTFITSSENHVFLPSPSYESSVLGTNGACSDGTSSLFTAGYGNECAFYTQAFNVYNGTPGYSRATPTGTPGQLLLVSPAKILLTEQMVTARVDQNIASKDKAFLHFKYDHGVQPTYNDPINTAFSADSDQPDYEGQLAETHTFSPKAVNQFLVTGSYYSAIFVNKDPAKELATFPFEMEFLDGMFSTLNYDALAWPEGRNVTQVQFGDDFSYNLGKHNLKVGIAFKKDYVSDQDTGVLDTPLILTDSAYGDFQSGQSDLGVKDTPTNLNLPITLYTLGFYAGDDWKPMPNLTITAGIRVERNSNPTCTKNCLSNFGGDFFTLAASAPLDSAAGAYNAQIKSHLADAFTNYAAAEVEPRLGFNWSPTAGSKTVVRGGAGFFSDVFPGTIADTMLDNPPLTTSFTVYGALFGAPAMALNPSDPTSAQSLIAGANATFQSGFASGGSFNTMSAANPYYSAPNFTTVAAHLKYPTYLEYNLQVQHAFTRTDSIQVGYVGNTGHHEPTENTGVNAYLGAYGLPAASPAPSFASVNEIESEAYSNYNGLIASYRHEGHGLTAQFNYAWSHALDEISNGGILPVNTTTSITTQINPYSLKQNYGNADYDTRQYFNGSYLYAVPHFGGPKLLTDGWQVAGVIYYGSGTPFTPMELMTDQGIGSYDQGGGSYPLAPAPGTNHHCGPSSATTPCLTAADFPTAGNTSVSPFGQEERNQFFGPHYFDTDLTLIKSFKLLILGDAGKIEIGATAYNLFNHPSFANPNPDIDNGPGIFGSSFTAVGPPTSIYGAFLGGDDSVRILQLTAKVHF